jgi:hypothetical protein
MALIGVFIFAGCSTTPPEAQIALKTVEPENELEKSKRRGKGRPFKAYIKEINRPLSSDIEVPPACLVNLREFIGYLFSNSPNIFYNEEARRKWFADNLQRAAANHLKVYQRESQKQEFPTFPDNSTFIGASEYPTTYSIVKAERLKNQIEISVLFEWKNTQNYNGDTRIGKFDFVEEYDARGSSFWRIHALSYEASSQGFAPVYPVNERLWSERYE